MRAPARVLLIILHAWLRPWHDLQLWPCCSEVKIMKPSANLSSLASLGMTVQGEKFSNWDTPRIKLINH